MCVFGRLVETFVPPQQFLVEVNEFGVDAWEAIIINLA